MCTTHGSSERGEVDMKRDKPWMQNVTQWAPNTFFFFFTRKDEYEKKIESKAPPSRFISVFLLLPQVAGCIFPWLFLSPLNAPPRRRAIWENPVTDPSKLFLLSFSPRLEKWLGFFFSLLHRRCSIDKKCISRFPLPSRSPHLSSHSLIHHRNQRLVVVFRGEERKKMPCDFYIFLC